MPAAFLWVLLASVACRADALGDFKELTKLEEDAGARDAGRTQSLRRSVVAALRSGDEALTGMLIKDVEDESQYPVWFNGDSGVGPGRDVGKVREFTYLAYTPGFTEWVRHKLRRGLYPGAQRYLVSLLLFHDLECDLADRAMADLTTVALDPAFPRPARIDAATLMGLAPGDLTFTGADLSPFHRRQYAEMTSVDAAAFWLDQILSVDGAAQEWLGSEKESALGMIGEAEVALVQMNLAVATYKAAGVLADALGRYAGPDPTNKRWHRELADYLAASGPPSSDARAMLAEAADHVSLMDLPDARRLHNGWALLDADPAAASKVLEDEWARAVSPARAGGRPFNRNAELLGRVALIATRQEGFAGWARGKFAAGPPSELSGFLAEEFFIASFRPRGHGSGNVLDLTLAVATALRDPAASLPARLRLLAVSQSPERRHFLFSANGVDYRDYDEGGFRTFAKQAAEPAFRLAESGEFDRFASIATGTGYFLNRDLAIWIDTMPPDDSSVRSAIERVGASVDLQAGRADDLKYVLQRTNVPAAGGGK